MLYVLFALNAPWGASSFYINKIDINRKELYKAKIIMIISASRRTDIPAFYSQWLFNRLNQGFVMAKNPINPRLVSKIPLNPQLIDCIVFWTKNPGNIMDQLDHLRDYNYLIDLVLLPNFRIKLWSNTIIIIMRRVNELYFEIR